MQAQMTNPILDFGIEKSTFRYTGFDLQRPECILAERDGALWSWDGGVRIGSHGTQSIVRPKRSAHFVGASSGADVLFETGQAAAAWMASVTLGGPDLRTAYLGSLKGSRDPYFQPPAPGLPMVHWNDAA